MSETTETTAEAAAQADERPGPVEPWWTKLPAETTTDEIPAEPAPYAAGVDRTGRWWVTAPDGAMAYRFGGGPNGAGAARAAAQRANDGGAIGVPPWPSVPPEVRPANESVEVPIRGNDLLNEDSYDSKTTRAAADGYDERLWRRRGF